MGSPRYIEQFPTWKAYKRFFMGEAKIHSLLKHPNIVEVYDFVVDDEKQELFLVMENVEGGSLADLCEKKYFKGRAAGQQLSGNNLFVYPLLYLDWRTNEAFASEIIRQVISAVGYLHAHHICHRGLKPENILITSTKTGTPTVKLCDFGFATIFHKNKYGLLNSELDWDFYMAPETLNLEKHTGYSVDIWSIGVLSLLLSTGLQPFSNAGIPEDLDENVIHSISTGNTGLCGFSESKL